MLQGVNTDHLNPLVPKVHSSECQNKLFPLQASKSQLKPYLVDFYFLTFGTNGVTKFD